MEYSYNEAKKRANDILRTQYINNVFEDIWEDVGSNWRLKMWKDKNTSILRAALYPVVKGNIEDIHRIDIN